ncbi:MAG: DUF1801 domain-containing protein [candidate division KSB1 bacterium]|nr:DUF1801 domain-containing protein [candidate division KSB1 bacterium]
MNCLFLNHSFVLCFAECVAFVSSKISIPAVSDSTYPGTYCSEGFEETTSYGMIGYEVPHRLYPAGYHVSPDQPLLFVHLALQKNYIALYHMGLYVIPELLEWFKTEYAKHSRYKLDMGKSCIRFKRLGVIPFKLVGVLMSKISVQDWINIYEQQHKR